MKIEQAEAQVGLLEAAFGRTLEGAQKQAYVNALAVMPLDVAEAAISSTINGEEKWPTVATVNKHAKGVGWEPERTRVLNAEERSMLLGLRERFRMALGSDRPTEPADLRYYGLLVSYRWAVKTGTFPRVETRLRLMGETATGAANHVRAEMQAGKVLPPVRQEELA